METLKGELNHICRPDASQKAAVSLAGGRPLQQRLCAVCTGQRFSQADLAGCEKCQTFRVVPSKVLKLLQKLLEMR